MPSIEIQTRLWRVDIHRDYSIKMSPKFIFKGQDRAKMTYMSEQRFSILSSNEIFKDFLDFNVPLKRFYGTI